jgi:thiol-disulfide isomerase/thioredoxin
MALFDFGDLRNMNMNIKSMIRISVAATGLAAVGVFATGCNTGAESETTVADTSTPAVETVSRPTQVAERSPNAMPDFALQDLEGNVVRLSDYAGKTVLINFWATWCGPCKIELPDLVEIQSELGARDFVVLGVSLDRTGPAPVRRFVEQAGLNYPILMGNQDVVIQFENFQMIPTSFLLAPNQEKVKHYTGVVSKDQLLTDIQKVLEG